MAYCSPSTHRQLLSNALWEEAVSGRGGDAVIETADGTVHRFHRDVLVKYSGYVEAWHSWYGEMPIHIRLPGDITPDVLVECLRFCYTGQVALPWPALDPYVEFAAFMNIQRLMDVCKFQVESRAAPWDAPHWGLMARFYDMGPDLVCRMDKMVAENILWLTGSESFLCMQPVQLAAVVAMCDPVDAVRAVLVWLADNWDIHRGEYAGLMDVARAEYLTAAELSACHAEAGSGLPLLEGDPRNVLIEASREELQAGNFAEGFFLVGANGDNERDCLFWKPDMDQPSKPSRVTSAPEDLAGALVLARPDPMGKPSTEVYLLGTDTNGDGCLLYNSWGNSWKRLSAIPDGGRTDGHGCFVGPDTIYYFGGIGPDGNVSDRIFRYDVPKDEWRSCGTLPEPNHKHCAVLHEGKVYVVGGSRRDPGQVRVISIYEFEPETGTCRKLPSLRHWEAYRIRATGGPDGLYLSLRGQNDNYCNGAYHLKYHPVDGWCECTDEDLGGVAAHVHQTKVGAGHLDGYLWDVSAPKRVLRRWKPKEGRWEESQCQVPPRSTSLDAKEAVSVAIPLEALRQL